MKIRTGFVSNSSSSSFVIDLYVLSPKQREQISNHIEVAKKLEMDMFWDAWQIGVNDGAGVLWGEAFMDNFDMALFLHEIGVADEDIRWDGAEAERARNWEWYDED